MFSDSMELSTVSACQKRQIKKNWVAGICTSPGEEEVLREKTRGCGLGGRVLTCYGVQQPLGVIDPMLLIAYHYCC